MPLHDAPDRQGPDLDESHPPEIRGLEDVYLTLVAKQNVGFGEKRVPVHRPESPAGAVMLGGPAVVEIMDVVVVHRRQPREDHGTAFKTPRNLIAENPRGVEAVPFDWKLLPWFQVFPAEIPRFGEGSHAAGLGRECPHARAEAALEEFRVAPVGTRLELAHV